MWNLKKVIQKNSFTKQKQTHLRMTYVTRWEEQEGRDREFGMDMYTLLYI